MKLYQSFIPSKGGDFQEMTSIRRMNLTRLFTPASGGTSPGWPVLAGIMVVEETINDPAFPNPIPDGIHPFLQVGPAVDHNLVPGGRHGFNSFPVSQPAEIDEVGRIRIMFFRSWSIRGIQAWSIKVSAT